MNIKKKQTYLCKFNQTYRLSLNAPYLSAILNGIEKRGGIIVWPSIFKLLSGKVGDFLGNMNVVLSLSQK